MISDDYTIIVSGHGRCGSSLVLQMLKAGGINVTGEYPAFEDEVHTLDNAILPVNTAVKILDPHTIKIKSGNYKWIWLNRDHTQQAKSMVKFIRGMAGLPIPESSWKDIAKSYIADTKECLEKIKKSGGELIILNFEDLLSSPLEQAKRIQKMIPNLDIDKAVNEVRKRKPENYKGFMEVDLYFEENIKLLLSDDITPTPYQFIKRVWK